MLRSTRTSLLCVLTLLPGLLLVACGDDEDAADGAAGSASGGSSAAAGESSSGKASIGGANASAGNGSVAGEMAGAGNGATLATVNLGTAENYAVLAKSEISNVPTSKVTGDLGLSPAAASYITGFALTKSGVSWTPHRWSAVSLPRTTIHPHPPCSRPRSRT